MILLTLLVGLLAISSVSASDVADETNNLVSTNAVENQIENSYLQSSDDVKTFDDLKKEINELSDNGTLELHNDYKYNGSSDSSIISIGQNNVTIDGNDHTLNAGGAQIFEISGNNVTIKNLIFANATFYRGGAAITNYGNGLTLINCSFIKNAETTEYGGGAIINRGTNFTVINSSFIDNVASATASYGGGAIANLNNDNMTIINSIFINNTSEMHGAIYGNCIVVNSTFANNFARASGGVLSGGCVVVNSSFVNNSALNAGVILGNCVVVNSTFVNNSALSYNGGAISGGSCVVVNSTFVNNSALNAAGAISGGSCVVVNSTFVNNSAKNSNGGAISGSSCVVVNSTFVNNSAINNGGAVYNEGNLTVSKSNFIYNMADVGGAIYNAGNNSVVEVSEFVNNNAVNGGAIGNVADNVSVLSSEFVNNTAKENGGAIMNNGTDFVAKNNTFKGNNATNGSDIYGDVYAIYLDSKDISMFFKDGTRFVAVLSDSNGNLLSNQTLTFTINGLSYDRSTDENGSASIALNLVSGTYNANVYFNGTSEYNSVSKNITVDIKSTVDGSNLVKMYQNDTQFYATFLGSDGKALANTTVKFNINGVFYNRPTDSNGTAKLSINLRPGEYVLTAISPFNDEEKGFNVSVKSLIEASDLNKYYKNDSKFEAKVYNKDGTLAINKTVEFNINGAFYKRMTDENGTVSLAINLIPGEYAITTIYDGLEVGNKVKVLSTLETNDLSMNYLDGSKFSVKTLDGQGNPLANQTVKFNVNGVFYNRSTGDDGIANLNINLIRGQYIITSVWNGYEVGNEIKIS